MKKIIAIVMLCGVVLLPLACGKNLSPETVQNPVTVITFPTVATTPTWTPNPGSLSLSSSATLSSHAYNFSDVHFSAGASIVIQGAVTFNLTGNFYLDAAATITGSGQNFGGPGFPPLSQGGGGHGGQGGADGSGEPGGFAYDNATVPAYMGSEGGYGSGFPGPGGNGGGALIFVNAPNGTASINGHILMNGATNVGGGGTWAGGGAGGTIYIKAVSIIGTTGDLEASGGAGEPGDGWGCGGGGGGIIVLSVPSALNYQFAGIHSVDGGVGGPALVNFSAGIAGEPGVFNVVVRNETIS